MTATQAKYLDDWRFRRWVAARTGLDPCHQSDASLVNLLAKYLAEQTTNPSDAGGKPALKRY